MPTQFLEHAIDKCVIAPVPQTHTLLWVKVGVAVLSG